ncbi:MAG: hypothetical protein RLY20_1298 [Verrucomicrobiota bacterium]|jgi:cytochrome oxidase Cu insertion factor (SCO1/SenC/PrrC family)
MRFTRPKQFISSLLALAGILFALSASAGDKQPAAAPVQADALVMLFQVVDQLTGFVTNRDLTAIHNEDETLAAALTEFLARPETYPIADAAKFRRVITNFSQSVGVLHAAGDLNSQPRSDAALKVVQAAFIEVQNCFPPAAVNAARERSNLFRCPLHPEIIGRRSETCSKCGSTLDQSLRLFPFNPAATANRPVIARLDPATPLRVGVPVELTLRLRTPTGEPITPIDLIETHTRKVHLLITDESLADYHHEHPQPTKVPGEYRFRFTPHNPGSYRFWADIRPYPLGLQQYAVANLDGEAPGRPIATYGTLLKTEVDGLQFELQLPAEGIEARRSAAARLRVTDTNGQPVTTLEPTMAAFSHLVGFYEDRTTVLHLHPTGAPITDPTARGGPELEFMIFALKSGYVRLFAQVQHHGQLHTAAFIIGIKPAGSIAPRAPVQRRLIPFELTAADGTKVTEAKFAGKIVVANLMYTGCSLSSREVMQRLREFQQRTAHITNLLHVSLTLDPRSDTPEALAAFAQGIGADTNKWLFLTGDREQVRRLVRESFFPSGTESSASPASNFAGLDTVTVIDPAGNLTETFEGLNPELGNQLLPAVEKLARTAKH